MLNKSGESGHPFLIPDLRGDTFSFSLWSVMLAVGLLYMAFIMLRYVPSGFPTWLSGKDPPANAGDMHSIPASGISGGKRNGHPLQYSCLENSMDREAWRATVHGAAKTG